MNYSKYIQMKQKAANVYKSNWQARDASEVTLRRVAISNKPNSTVHQGPDNVCCLGPTETTGSSVSTQQTFGPVPAAITWTLINMTLLSPTSIICTGGGTWDNSAYSSEGYVNNAFVKCTAAQTTGNIACGFSETPSASNVYTNLTYGFFFSTILLILENGVTAVNLGSYTTSTQCLVVYDGTDMIYYVDGVEVHRTVRPVGNPLYLFIAAIDDSGLNNIYFGPLGEQTITTTTGSTESSSIPTIPSAPQAPGNGFSTDYSMDIVSNKRAGCAVCQDDVWGTSGGVQLRTCAEVELFSRAPSNPMKGTNLTIPYTSSIITPPCVSRNDPGVVQRGLTDCLTVTPKYTGWRNQVPTSEYGQKPLQQYPYPSA